MTAAGDLHQALDDLERVQADIARIAGRSDPERLRELVDLRRALSARFAVVGPIAESAFAEDAALLAAYRKAFSAMRSAAALHQANWPAVRLDQADSSYHDSVLALRAANRHFLETVRAALAKLEPRGGGR